GDCEESGGIRVGEAVLGLSERGNRLERDLYAASVDLERQRPARAGSDDLLDVWETLDRPPVDGENQVARLKAGCLCGAAGLHSVDAGRWRALAMHQID